MSPATIRFGGMAVFLNIGFAIIIVALGFILPSLQIPLGLFLSAVTYILWAFTLWCLAAYLTSQHFDRANGVILAMILFSVIYVILQVVTVIDIGLLNLTPKRILEVRIDSSVEVAKSLISVIMFFLGLRLGKRIMAFSAEYDRPRIWMFVGLCIILAYALYLMYIIFVVVGVLAGSAPTVIAAMVIVLLGVLVGFAAYLLMGVGLMRGADTFEYEAEPEVEYSF